ncbi:MAG: hypothetical protein E7230_03925 [Clostridiales bacterium]|nr:hypothetical protein [Clostridiales bacterium]
MKKKHIPFMIIAIVLIAVMAAWLIASHKPEEVVVTEEDPLDQTESDAIDLEEREGNDISFEEEDDEAVIEKVETEVSKYFGSWEATSDMALYLYGNIDITVKEDGTWEGNITGEPLGGTWEDKGDHLHMNDTLAELFDFDLAFDKGGHLILIDTDNDDEVHTVLTKKQ